MMTKEEIIKHLDSRVSRMMQNGIKVFKFNIEDLDIKIIKQNPWLCSVHIYKGSKTIFFKDDIGAYIIAFRYIANEIYKYIDSQVESMLLLDSGIQQSESDSRLPDNPETNGSNSRVRTSETD